MATTPLQAEGPVRGGYLHEPTLTDSLLHRVCSHRDLGCQILWKICQPLPKVPLVRRTWLDKAGVRPSSLVLTEDRIAGPRELRSPQLDEATKTALQATIDARTVSGELKSRLEAALGKEFEAWCRGDVRNADDAFSPLQEQPEAENLMRYMRIGVVNWHRELGEEPYPKISGDARLRLEPTTKMIQCNWDVESLWYNTPSFFIEAPCVAAMTTEPTIAAKCTAEFVGTFLLIFTVGCNVLGGSATWAGVSIAFVLMVCIYALGGISGANFNPAVSVTLGISRAMGGPGLDWKTVGIYAGVQTAAGISAAICYSLLFGQSFNLAPAKGFSWYHAGLCELLYTFMLTFVVMNVAAAKKNVTEKNQYYGMAIAFTVVAGAYGAGAVSGGCFNPAVALGIDVSSAGRGFGWSIAYVVFELLGAATAAALFKVVRPEDFGGEKSQATELVSEFLGTYMLVLTVGLNVLGSSKAAAFSIAAGLTSMIYALGDVSGAHFNPAVTVAILASGRCPELTPAKAGTYAGVQIAGGIAAAMTYAFIYKGVTFGLGPVGSSTWAGVSVAEIVYTFVLCFVVLCVAVSERTKASHLFGLAIGSCVTVGGFAIGGISGGSLNPAVSFGIAAANILNGGFFFKALIYSGFELVGAAVAAGVFKVTHELEHTFPFDSHEMSAIFWTRVWRHVRIEEFGRSYALGTSFQEFDVLGFRGDPTPCPGWDPYICESNVVPNRARTGELMFYGRFWVRRKPFYFIVALLFPTAVVTFMGASAILIASGEVPNGIVLGGESPLSLVAGLMLTMVAMKFSYTESVPKLGYLTMLDTYIAVSFLFLSAAALLIVLLPEELLQQLRAAAVFSGLCLLFNIVYAVIAYREFRIPVEHSPRFTFPEVDTRQSKDEEQAARAT
eukprot:s44_g17.t2